jgi:hypothetical protein
MEKALTEKNQLSGDNNASAPQIDIGPSDNTCKHKASDHDKQHDVSAHIFSDNERVVEEKRSYMFGKLAGSPWVAKKFEGT